MNARRRLLGIALAAAFLLAPALSSAAPPAAPVRIDSVKVDAVSPLVGANLTITVEMTNNASFPLTLSNLTVVVTGGGAEPEVIAALVNVLMPANNTTRFVFHWVATAGVKVVTAQAFVLVANDSFPLSPASARVEVDNPQTAEAGAVVGVIVIVLCAVMLLAILPAVFEHGASGEKGAARAAGKPEARPPPEKG